MASEFINQVNIVVRVFPMNVDDDFLFSIKLVINSFFIFCQKLFIIKDLRNIKSFLRMNYLSHITNYLLYKKYIKNFCKIYLHWSYDLTKSLLYKKNGWKIKSIGDVLIDKKKKKNQFVIITEKLLSWNNWGFIYLDLSCFMFKRTKIMKGLWFAMCGPFKGYHRRIYYKGRHILEPILILKIK